ncbi:hypothetical protein WOLCODRAFT_153220 [Wolfiporia cocos MD-104 SS10]|uniref:Uncharacterized protein n=1 Tax=Wolfiporia cocos (strain MD-104) TaxID=742152 RepID=A0A2H3JLT2_WOLCO|nr:hypothetical protein WOLCODRAFT_153220 [Wolfiporia cocos MD-104 SS10]
MLSLRNARRPRRRSRASSGSDLALLRPAASGAPSGHAPSCKRRRPLRIEHHAPDRPPRPARTGNGNEGTRARRRPRAGAPPCARDVAGADRAAKPLDLGVRARIWLAGASIRRGAGRSATPALHTAVRLLLWWWTGCGGYTAVWVVRRARACVSAR